MVSIRSSLAILSVIATCILCTSVNRANAQTTLCTQYVIKVLPPYPPGGVIVRFVNQNGDTTEQYRLIEEVGYHGPYTFPSGYSLLGARLESYDRDIDFAPYDCQYHPVGYPGIEGGPCWQVRICPASGGCPIEIEMSYDESC